MPLDRTSYRNVFVEFASHPGEVQGGLCASRSLTCREFLDMLEIVFHADDGFDAHLYGTTTAITRTNRRLEHGRYILTPRRSGQTIQTSDENYTPRTLSISNTARQPDFCRQVRNRDQRCVITGLVNHEIDSGFWPSWEAAHIFPLALNGLFLHLGFDQLITYYETDAINSPQNGILLRRDMHSMWDSYCIAVNPNNGYRVQSFRPSAWDYQGRILHPVCRQPGDNRAVVDVLLQWHYEQAVLCNMRGAGEALLDFDCPPGSDIMGQIREGPQAPQRMEAELFTRLFGFSEQHSVS